MTGVRTIGQHRVNTRHDPILRSGTNLVEVLLGRGYIQLETHMRKILQLTAIPFLLGSALAMTACSSPAEKAAENVADKMEDQADMVRDNAEMVADNIEARGDNMDAKTDGMDSAAEEKMDNKAAVVRDRAENTADAMEDKADVVRDKGNK